MSTLFKQVAGTVLAVKPEGDTSPQAGIVQITTAGGGGVTESADIIVTSLTMPNEVVHRRTPTIGGPNYLFAFGDDLSKITISAVMFAGGSCDGETNGISSAFRFYAANRLTPANAPLIHVVYGGVNIRGFLVGFAPSSQGGTSLLYHTCAFTILGWVDEPWFDPGSAVSVGAGSQGDVASLATPDTAGADDTRLIRDFLGNLVRPPADRAPSARQTGVFP